MRYAYREVVTPGMAVLVAGISVGLLAIVSTLGPMGTLETLTLVHRFAYFGVITVFAAPICFAAGFFCVYAMRNRSAFSATLALALMCAVVAAPCSISPAATGCR